MAGMERRLVAHRQQGWEWFMQLNLVLHAVIGLYYCSFSAFQSCYWTCVTGMWLPAPDPLMRTHLSSWKHDTRQHRHFCLGVRLRCHNYQIYSFTLSVNMLFFLLLCCFYLLLDHQLKSTKAHEPLSKTKQTCCLWVEQLIYLRHENIHGRCRGKLREKKQNKTNITWCCLNLCTLRHVILLVDVI